VVATGVSTEDRDEALAEIATAFAIGAPVALLLAAGLGYLLATRALAPVEALRRRASKITLDRRGERLDLPAADDELRALAATLNEMLDRIEGSLERERVFVADASHELRTPLAILRAELELATRPDRTPEELRAALASAADEVERLARLADDLLVLARADEGGVPIRREPVELGELVDRVVARFSARAKEAGRGVVVEVPAGLVAEIDPLRVEQALGNLVDNALRHGNGQVRVSAAGGEGGFVTLSVSDEGAGFAPGFAESAFERFTRADTGRGSEGAGLGLAIVSAIAAAHGGRASIDPSARGATVRLDLDPA
jgi:signal transduction histidine kinase